MAGRGELDLVGFLPVIGAMFLIGLIQGLTVCNLTCGPFLMLRLAGQGKGVRKGLALSLYYALPRVLLLTLLGGALGALGYGMGEISGIKGYAWVQAVLYVMIGILMIATGLWFSRTRTARECGEGKSVTFLERAAWRLGSERGRYEGLYMFAAGIIISLLCLAEAGAVSLSVSSLLGLESEDLGRGLVSGALNMFSYSLGLTLPLLALGTFSSELGRRLVRRDVRKVGGFLLMLIGSILVSLVVLSLFV